MVIYGTQVKWWYLQVFFFIFPKFWFLDLVGGGGGRGGSVKQQKMAHIDKKCCPSHLVFRTGIDNWDESWVS